MPILDIRGRPVDTSKLTKEVATPTLRGVRPPSFESVISGMTPSAMSSLLMRSAEGDVHDYLTLAEEMEERDLHYKSVITTRKLTVSGLTVSVDAKTDAAADVALADEVREQLVEAPQFEDMLFDALDALGKGYSITEIDWDKSESQWEPASYQWRDQRYFKWDETLAKLRLISEKDMVNGEELPPYKFIIHRAKLKSGLPLRGGIARLVAVAYMCKAFDITDWLAFIEVYGMPIRIGYYGDHTSEEDRERLASAVANLGSDAAAIVHDKMKLELLESGGGKGSTNDKIFEGFANYMDSQVSKAVLGQTMTTDDGSSMSQAKVHNDVRLDLLRADARQLTTTLNRDLVIPYIDLNHGPRKKNEYPRIRIAYEEPEDLKALTEAAIPWVDRGMTVEVSVMRDKFGLPEPEDGANVIGPMVKPAMDEGDEEDGDDEEGDGKEKPKGKKPTNNSRLQRALVALNRRDKDRDEIDRIIEGAGDWEELTEEVFEPLMQAINGSRSYEELDAKLDELSLNLDPVIDHLATQMFKARGLGDGTDNL